MPLEVGIDWSRLKSRGDARWACTRVLYALCHPLTDRVVYLGKADFASVRERFNCRSKDRVWARLKDRFGVDAAIVRVGEFYSEARLTVELLADVESLLIKRLQPFCNTQSRRSRIERPGLRVTCGGDWPEPRADFIDR